MYAPKLALPIIQDKDDLEEDEEEEEAEAAIEFKEGDDMTQNIYSNAKAM